MGGCNFRNISPINVPKCHRGKFMFFLIKKLSKLSDFYYLEPGLYPSITDILEAMKTLVQEKHNDSDSCIRDKVSRRTQKVEIYLANKGSGLAFFRMDLGHIFGSNVGNDIGVMLRGKGPHKPEIAYYICRIYSLIIHTDLIEYNNVGETKAPMLRFFPFISKLKTGDIITTGQYMNYQTFGNFKLRPHLKIFFHSIHIDLRDRSVEMIPFVFAVLF